MSYDRKGQKTRPELPNGAALSTLVLEPEEDRVDPAADGPWKSPTGDDTQKELPRESDEE